MVVSKQESLIENKMCCEEFQKSALHQYTTDAGGLQEVFLEEWKEKHGCQISTP
jgi:hypothetical protein